jgi:acyl-CoA synthetase (NDP forming)
MPEPAPERPSLEPLLRARSLAVVGASGARDTFGHALFRQVLDRGFAGALYPVNPGRAEIDGIRCYPSLADLPERVDCALLAVGDERLEAALRAVAEAGIAAAVVFGGSSPHPNRHPEGTRPSAVGEGSAAGDWLSKREAASPETPHAVNPPSPIAMGEGGRGVRVHPDRLRRIASDANLALLGGNAMGFYNCVDRLFVSGYPPAAPLPAGGIALISHSGSAFSAFANNRRGLRCSYLISPGQELMLSTADYLWFVLEQPETRVVGVFLEAVRDPAGFVAGLAEAARREIPVVVLKVGRSERGRALALAHSGALAGADEAFAALCARWGVLQTRSLDELADTLELLAAPRRPRGGGLALAGDLGGERALIADRAAEIGVPWAALGAETLAAIGAVLEPGLDADNPLDLWGSGRDWERSYETCLAAMAADPAVGCTVLAIDLVTGSRLVPGYLDVVERVHAATERPVAVMGNLASAIDPAAADRLRNRGITVLMGTDTALAALRHALTWRPAAPVSPLDRDSLALAATWRQRLCGRTEPLDEIESKCLLADWGISVVAERLVETEAEALAAARALGWPVVVKTAAPGILHKSDAGGIRLGLADETAVASAFGALRERFGPRAVVQRQIAGPHQVEMFLGMTSDLQFGPLVAVGIGGIWVEALRDVVMAMPPLDAPTARTLLARLRGYAMLEGLRGAPPVDLMALAEAIAAFSRMAAALGDAVDQVDVNPLLAGADGVVAVDALVVPGGVGEGMSKG